MVSLVSRDIPNFWAPTPSRGRPPAHPKISGPKNLGLASFFLPERNSLNLVLELGCRKWGCNKWGLKGCLAALPGNRPKSAFFALFCLFRPFPEGAKSTWEIQKTEEKGLFPQISSDLLKPLSLKPPFAALQLKPRSPEPYSACFRVLTYARGGMLTEPLPYGDTPRRPASASSHASRRRAKCCSMARIAW